MHIFGIDRDCVLGVINCETNATFDTARVSGSDIAADSRLQFVDKAVYLCI